MTEGKKIEPMIWFTLDKRIPETLHAQYKNRYASIGLAIVPKVMESGGMMLYEEQIIAAVDYLKIILDFPLSTKE